MANDVKNTSPKPIIEIDRRQRQKLFHDVYHAASKSSGGRKIRKIMSGSTVMAGMPGIKLMPRPPITKNIGYEIEKRWLNKYSSAMAKNSARMRKSWCSSM